MKRKNSLTIKDLPLELIRKISKYGEQPFNPRKDIGPLEPKDIESNVTLKDTNSVSYGALAQSMLKAKDNILRSEQGPLTKSQAMKEHVILNKSKLDALLREAAMIEAIYGKERAKMYIDLNSEAYKYNDEYHYLATGRFI